MISYDYLKISILSPEFPIQEDFVKHTTALAIAIIAIALVLLTEPNDKGMAQLKKLERQWLDEVELARSTPRSELPYNIGTLGAIRSGLRGVVVSKCLEEAKATLDEAMERTHKGFNEFAYSSGKNSFERSRRESSALKKVEEGIKKHSDYKQVRDKCSK